ncbi:MAG: hypothetical protein JWQ89_818, partial [Devosia sp.]|uniref:hypothetical protein n=1 Tax=Devosia sp. TaxID=1871048 RepID=UPI002610FE15
FHGAVVMCNLAKQCVTISDFCDIGMFDPSQAKLLGNAEDFTGSERTVMRGMFPWAATESDLMSAFWVAQARECLNRAVTHTTPDSLVKSDDSPPPVRNFPD